MVTLETWYISDLLYNIKLYNQVADGNYMLTNNIIILISLNMTQKQKENWQSNFWDAV